MTFKYGGTKKNVLQNISFKIKKGEIIVIKGESGFKALLINLMLGLLKPEVKRIYKQKKI